MRVACPALATAMEGDRGMWDLGRDDVGQVAVVLFCGDVGYALFCEGHADDEGVGAKLGEEAVIVAAAVAEAVEVWVEGDYRHDDGIDVVRCDQRECSKSRVVDGVGAQGSFRKGDAASLIVLAGDFAEGHERFT